jgi:ABC-type sugar transport system substrate-binding protein
MKDVKATRDREPRRLSRPTRLLVSLAALGIAGAAALGASAAGNVSAGSTAGPGSKLYIGKPTKAVCAGKSYTIGYDTFSDTDLFTHTMNQAQFALAKKLGCVKIVQLIDNADPGTALQNAKILAQRKVDGVILLNVIAAAQPGIAQIFRKAKIPMAPLYIRVPGSIYITADEKNAGLVAGLNLGKAFVSKNPGVTPYAIVGRWDEGGKNAIDRMNGVANGIRKSIPSIPDDRILSIQSKGDPSTAQARTLDVLNKIPADSKIILVGQNDDITHGMFQAVKQVGRQNSTMVVAIGGARPVGFNYICQNPQYVGVVGYTPERWPDYTIPALLGVIQGKKVPRNIIVPTPFIARDKIKKFYPDFKCGEK